MKRIILSLWFVAFLFSFSFAQEKTSIKLRNNDSYFKVLSKSTTSFTAQVGMNTLSLIKKNTKGGDFYSLQIEGLMKTYNVGTPDVPVLSKMIELPQDANIVFKVISFDEQIIKLSDFGITKQIIPAQASVSKSSDPTRIPFEYNAESYAKNEFNFKEIGTFEDLGTMRYTRLGRIELHPVQYNPVKNELRILNNLVVEVTFVNSDLAKTAALKENYSSIYFESARSGAINAEKSSKELIMDNPTDLLIVSDPMFTAQLAPFIAWKEQKGIRVTVKYTNTISGGATTTAIKTYIQSQYNGTNSPEFVLLVGDNAQIPGWAGSAGSHITDLRYVEFTGDDLPEIYYGRFSASTTAMLQPQIDKSLEYEKYLMPDPSYLNQVVMVAGDDASNEMTYGNGQINYGTSNYFNATNGLTSHTYLQPLDNTAASTQIRQNISDGVSFANYTAHCSPDGWATPGFSISQIAGLTNIHKYGLLVGNCCQSNQFQDDSFGEAILRAQDKGAIGYIGGTNSTYWDEDYWWGVGLTSTISANPTYEASGEGSYDGMFHNKANEVNDPTKWFPTQSQMNVCGQLAVNSGTSSKKQYYWEIYMLMGDPTIMPFIGVPTAQTVSLTPGALMLGMTSLSVNCAPYSYVAMHQNGVLVAIGLANSLGVAELSFASDAIIPGTADLVITAQNKIPYFGSVVVSPANAPYVLMNTCVPNSNLNFGQNVTLNVNLSNVAAEPQYEATNVLATLTTTDANITITDATESYGTIAAGANITINDAFGFTIANNVADQHFAEFTLTITDGAGGHTWVSTTSMTINAPVLDVTFSQVNDIAAFTSTPIMSINNLSPYTYSIQFAESIDNINGRLDAGESAGIIINALNNGHADLNNLICTLSSTSPYVTVNSNIFQIASLPVNGTIPAEFGITVDPATPIGTMVELTFTLSGGEYTKTVIFSQPVGLVIEDFESGNLTAFNWVLTGTPNWATANTGAFEGTYCAKSGAISSSGSTSMSLTLNGVSAGQTLKFNYKVSSESTYDYLKFYVGSTVVNSWSGEEAWTEYTHTFATAGNYVIKFEYMKDGSVNNGSDCAWIDNLILPVAPTKENSKSNITIEATVKPEWLDFIDNGDGTASLNGISPSNYGVHYVELTANTGSITAKQNFNITVGTLGLTKIDNDVSIYPNPTTGTLNIVVTNNTNSEVEVLDISGRSMLKTQLIDKTNSIDLSTLTKGIYIVKVRQNGNVTTSKVTLK